MCVKPYNDTFYAPDMDLDTQLSIPPQVISRLVDDETQLLDLESGTYFGLDGVGRRIWESVGNGLTLGETASVIESEYEVNIARAQSDVIEFALALVKKGLLIE
jgi:ABC-type hemin transport system substrate-binding protein